MSNPVIVRLQSQLQWRATKIPASGRWIGICDAMSLSMEADSLDELHSLINETLQLVFIDLLEDNELDQFLQERGWQAVNLPTQHDGGDIEFDVPWELIAEGARDPERRAN